MESEKIRAIANLLESTIEEASADLHMVIANDVTVQALVDAFCDLMSGQAGKNATRIQNIFNRLKDLQSPVV